MTLSALSQPDVARPLTGALPYDPALIDEDRRFATTWEQLQPCFLGYEGFARVIAAHSARFRGRPRLLELGCATGLLADELLNAVPTLEYRGIDESTGMLEIFARRCEGLPGPGPGITLSGPVDIRLKSSLSAALRGESADIVVMSQVLQSIPVHCSQVLTDRAGLIVAARRVIRPGGRIMIIEEVFGESLEEHRRFAAEWNHYALARISERFFEIEAGLKHVDPALLDLLAALPGRPSLVQVVREQIWRHGEPHVLPLSAWCRLFELMGVRYQAIPHESLKNVYMFVIES